MAITAGQDILASDFVTTSAGSADSGKVSKLNTFGFIDSLNYFDKGWGDAADGDATLDGTVTVAWASKVGSVYTLTRNVFFRTLTVNTGVTLEAAGYGIWGYRVTGAGTIRDNGANGGNASGGTGGTAAAARSAGTFPANSPGQIGGAGVSNNVGNNGVSGTNTNPSIGVSGVAGGNGGTLPGAGSPWSVARTGGGGGTATAESAQVNRNFTNLNLTSGSVDTVTSAWQPIGSTSGRTLSCSAGAGSGAAGNSTFITSGGTGGAGGGSGASGGIVFICAYTIDGTLTIQSLGGNGGNGGNGVGADAGGGGGGSGGSGGVVFLIYFTLGGSVTITVTGGTAGTGGSPTGGGGSPTAGSAGNAGTTGKIYKCNMTHV